MEEETKERMKLLRKMIRELALERKNLLIEQRGYRRELYHLKQAREG